MARKSGTKNELIKCEYCGEMYSTTYKHCPFCNEDGTGAWGVVDEPEEELEDMDYDAPRGGKRLASGGRSRGGRGGRQGSNIGSIVGWILSGLLIFAAICIVFSIARSFLGMDKKPNPTPTPPTAESVEPTPSEPVDTPPAETDDPTESQTPLPQVTTPSVDIVTPTSFSLNKYDVTLDHAGEQWNPIVTIVPADATAEVIWKSSDPNIASVSWNGKVTAVGKGTCTITASIEGVGEQSCIVRCRFENTATPNTNTNTNTNTSTGEGTGSTPANLTISRTDFTLSFAGDHWRLVVSGTDSTVTWTSSDPGVATVAADGTVTAVSKGTCTITAEVDGEKLTCIVRCNF